MKQKFYLTDRKDAELQLEALDEEGMFEVEIGEKIWRVSARRTETGVHLLVEGGSYDCHVSEEDEGAVVTLEGYRVPVGLLNERKFLRRKRSGGGSEGGNEIKSPMAGKVIEVKVVLGQTVSKGEGLMIIEAMKMENEIKSPRDGMISAIGVSSGQSIERGETLLQFEIVQEA